VGLFGNGLLRVRVSERLCYIIITSLPLGASYCFSLSIATLYHSFTVHCLKHPFLEVMFYFCQSRLRYCIHISLVFELFSIDMSTTLFGFFIQYLVQSAVDGYNVCIFAYGQTGSGKTYTIYGNESDPGLTPRATSELFKILKRDKHKYSFSLKVTVFSRNYLTFTASYSVRITYTGVGCGW